MNAHNIIVYRNLTCYSLCLGICIIPNLFWIRAVCSVTVSACITRARIVGRLPPCAQARVAGLVVERSVAQARRVVLGTRSASARLPNRDASVIHAVECARAPLPAIDGARVFATAMQGTCLVLYVARFFDSSVLFWLMVVALSHQRINPCEIAELPEQFRGPFCRPRTGPYTFTLIS